MKGRSEGSRLLARACEAHGQQAIAARLGCSRQFVCSLVAGQKRPSPERRERARAELGIDPSAWDQPPATSASTSAPTVATPPPAGETRARAGDREAPAAPLRVREPDASRGHVGAVAAARAHLRSCDEAIERFGPTASPRELAALLGAKAGAVRAYASAEPTWHKIFRSAEWSKIERVLREILAPLPGDVLGRLAARLEALDVEASRSGSKGGGS